MIPRERAELAGPQAERDRDDEQRLEPAVGFVAVDADVDAANRHLGADPIIGGLCRSRSRIRPPDAWDPFEAGIEAIVGQQATLAETARTLGRMVERCGTPVTGMRSPGLTHTFPPPSVLAEADLRGLGIDASSIASLHAFAQAAAKGTVELSRGTPPGALTASVVSIPGVCAGVAQYLALRLGERDAFPHTSPALLDALARVTGRSITARHVEGIAGRWRPWWTHATAHLWLSGQPPSLTALP